MQTLLHPALGLSVALTACALPPLRRRLSAVGGRSAWLAALAVAAPTSSASAQGTSPFPSARGGDALDAPWTRVSADTPPPPDAPGARVRAHLTHSPDGSPARHRAVHGGDPATPLFPRHADRHPEAARASDERRAKAASMAAHPSGKGIRISMPGGAYRVESGDTLWDIAARVLGTDDPGRVARYWPLIHRANRATIGGDPSLIYAGQELRLPLER